MSRGLPLALCLAAGLAGCFTIGDSKAPIGTMSVPALRPAAERTLDIVLPGFAHAAREMNGDNYQRQVWKMVEGWTPELARRVWLACGTSDHLIEDVRLLAPELPGSHYLELPGGHSWGLWIRSAKEVFSRIRLESGPPSGGAAEFRGSGVFAR